MTRFLLQLGKAAFLNNAAIIDVDAIFLLCSAHNQAWFKTLPRPILLVGVVICFYDDRGKNKMAAKTEDLRETFNEIEARHSFIAFICSPI